MNILAPISTIMTSDVISVKADDTLSHVAELFSKHKIHHLPVVKDGKLEGIISKSDISFVKHRKTESDLTQKLNDIKLNHYQVKEVMTTGIASLESTDKINVALEVFLVNLFHAIPVVDGGKLVGILTTFDIIRNIAKDKEAHASYEK